MITFINYVWTNCIQQMTTIVTRTKQVLRRQVLFDKPPNELAEGVRLHWTAKYSSVKSETDLITSVQGQGGMKMDFGCR